MVRVISGLVALVLAAAAGRADEPKKASGDVKKITADDLAKDFKDDADKARTKYGPSTVIELTGEQDRFGDGGVYIKNSSGLDVFIKTTSLAAVKGGGRLTVTVTGGKVVGFRDKTITVQGQVNYGVVGAKAKDNDNEKAKDKDREPKKVSGDVKKVTADELAKEFKDNADKARMKYNPEPPTKGAVIELTGELDKIERFALHLKNSSGLVILVNANRFPAYQPGQKIVVKVTGGKFKGYKDKVITIDAGFDIDYQWVKDGKDK
jgi:hypothetical protein